MPHPFVLPTRRRFVQGLAAAGGIATMVPTAARAEDIGGIPVLSGTTIDLTLSEMPVNITGRRRTATVINNAMPGPILRLREGDTVSIRVANKLPETSSIHWHGVKLPNAMDGVPGLTFAGIPSGETFTYRFPIVQAGTYWYHSHSGMQEQTGLAGSLIFEPKSPDPFHYDREYVVMLSDWTDENPMTIVSNLKQQSDYYNYHRRTLGTFINDAREKGLGVTIQDRLMWGKMRMSPTDIMDVTGATYTFLINGQSPAANWTALFRPGERVRLRFINSAAMTTFDVRIPGLSLSIVQADGTNVEPVEADEFRIGVAETYDVIVQPREDRAYTIFAQAQDRSGYARATLAIRSGVAGDVPAMDAPPLRTMADMGMGNMSGTAGMSGMNMQDGNMPDMDHGGGPDMKGMDMSGMGHMNMPGMAGMDMQGMNHGTSQGVPSTNATGVDPKALSGQPQVDNVAMMPMERQKEAGTGLDGNGRRVLRYAQLKAVEPEEYPLEPTRAIEFHLTGNMERWTWGFDGKRFSEAPPVPVKLGETVRFVLINDTMMEHPIHLHGFLFRVENGQGNRQPLKHTINVKPGERLSFVYTADTPGHWAFHCHLLYHMEMGMFRTVVVV
ncbi:MAG TPA: copper resistance system multicopper oxidase [Bryobacteraceae bacterium]